MPINYGKLRSLTVRELITALTHDGFIFDRQRGSHKHYRHADGRRVTLSFHHPGQTFAPKTLKRIIDDQAAWTEEDLRRLKLLS